MNPRIAHLLSRSRMAVTTWNRMAFRKRHGRWPNDPPRSFNDHIFQVKTHEASDPLRVFVADKALVKHYVKARIGESFVVPTLALYDDPATLRSGLAKGFPERCVIKPTHSCGTVLFADGPVATTDIETAVTWFDENLYTRTGEQLYQSLRPRVIVEPFLDLENGGGQPSDYKVFCAHGRPIYVSVDHWNGTDGLSSRFDRSRSYYTPDWTMLPFSTALPRAPLEAAPPMLARMLAAATTIAEDFTSIRVDFYASENECLVGELTNTSGNAGSRFQPDQRADEILGQAIREPDADLALLARSLETAPLRPAPEPGPPMRATPKLAQGSQG